MEQSINHCPHCNGTGKKTLKITFLGHPEKNEETEIDCIICEGKPMSKEDAIKEKKSMEDEKKSMEDEKKSMEDEKKSMEDEKKSMEDEKKSMEDEKKSMEDEKKLWCNCSNKTDSYYVADTKKMKHHWRCKTCKKITQIG
jgi:hypothetical protein